MNDLVVLDANVIAKLIVDEPNSELAARLFEREDLVFCTPSHALAELLEVVCRKVREGRASEQQLRQALLWLPGSFISVPIEALLELAADIAPAHAISIYDALYVALASERENRLVTDDRKLVARLSGTGLAPHVIALDEADRVLGQSS